ncbi:MAG: hypothetical protein FJ276_37195, partial [Planctomycetes bacterium]|nr:hypothetical protein [Planctomycetota bacterium]
MENPRDVLVAFLHDPPDKAFEIKGHEARALRYLETALGDAVSEAELKDVSDVLAATAERLPAPHWTQCTISWKNGHRRVHHPLSAFAPPPVADTPWTEAEIDRTIAALVDGIDVERRFLLLWRRLPEQLAHEHGAWFARLPADTRVPDHTLWHHLDTTAALKAARAGESEGAAFLSFSLGPVQSFIAAARSVRDLWSGSMILSWLTFHAMLPVVEQLGPTALIYPSLRGLPWLDRWLIKDRNLKGKIDEPSVDLRMTPCLPNRFLALVPWGHEGQIAVDLAGRCREAVKREWMKMAEAVKRELDQRLGGLPVDWSKRWPEQVENFFEYRTAVLPWRECASDATLAWLISGSDDFDKAFPDAAAVRKLAGAIPREEQPRYGQSSAGGWQAKVELSARLMQAQRSIRHVPPAAEADSPGQEFPPKCSLLGTYEQ